MNRFREAFKRGYDFFHPPWNLKKIIILTGVFTGTAFLFLLIIFIAVWSELLGPLPGEVELMMVENPASSEVYSADSVLLGRYYIQERSNLTFNELPPKAIDALLATEDIRFYQHGAIDKRSIVRVLVKSLFMQHDASGGGSTLTQQLAKNLYPRKSWWICSLLINKIREIIIATRLESIYDKNDILTLYLNTVPFGDNTYGLEAASRRFFSIPARDLTVDQAAVLIGMLKATYQYNPRLFTRKSLQRRNRILTLMRNHDLLSSIEYDSLVRLPISLDYNKITHHSGLAPYFRDYIREELLAWCTAYNASHEKTINLFTGGLKIYTTIDSRLQRYAEESVRHQMSITQLKFIKEWGHSDPLPVNSPIMQNAIAKSTRYKSLRARGNAHAQIIKIMHTPIAMRALTAEGEKEMKMSPLDSIRQHLFFLHAGFLAIDPLNGAVKVWVGGINHEFFQFDHIRQTTKRQVGSIFKPIVYAAAMEQGVMPCDFISAGKTTYANLKGWTPRNSTENYDLKYSMPGALAHSVNTVSVRVLEKAGIPETIELAKKMGIESPLPPFPSLALGTADLSMVEIVSAYTGFANKGNVVKPYYITSITTRRGEILQRIRASRPKRALSNEIAELVLHMLRRAVNEGTGSSLRYRFELQNDIAGKTGTTQSNTDGWFMAMIPGLVIGSWVGADLPQLHFRSTELGQGARTALPIVGEFFQRINKDKSLSNLAHARFPALPASLEDKISCASSKSDEDFLEKIFGPPKKEAITEIKKDFAKPTHPRKGFLKRLFSKRNR